MTEKRFYKTDSSIEKYRIYDDDLEDAYFISCDEHTIDTLIELLNEQDQRIKRLEKELEKEQLDDITMRERYRDNLLMDPTKCIHLKEVDKVIMGDGREHPLYKCEKGHPICQKSMFDPICEDYEIMIKSIRK